MRKQVKESLERLLSQNYIARNGDNYTFLTDDEQDIAREIRNTTVDSATIVQAISQIIFGDLYVTKKFRYDNVNDFSFDQIVDETVIGQLSGSIRLHILTVASDIYNSGDQALVMKSGTDNEAIVLLSSSTPYFEEIESAMKIRKYAKSRNITQLPEHIQAIIRGRQEQASAHEKRAKELITTAIMEAKYFVAGEIIDNRASSVKDKFDNALSALVESVYSKLSLIRKNYEQADSVILEILNNPAKQLNLDGSVFVDNSEAVSEIEQYLTIQSQRMLPTSMGDVHRRFTAIPYGWREIDIAATVASLILTQKLSIKYGGSTIQPTDRKMPDYLRRKTEIDKVVVLKREIVDPNLIKKSREFLREYFNIMDLPNDEDGVIQFVTESFVNEKEKLNDLLNRQYFTPKYPGKSIIEEGVKLCDELLSQKKDNTALLKKLVELQDDFLDFSDDFDEVTAFFKNQKNIFDSALELVALMATEKEYIQADENAVKALAQIHSITAMQKPYSKISEIPDLIQTVNKVYDSLLTLKKQEVITDIQSAMAEIHQTAKIHQNDIVTKADNALSAKKDAVEVSKSFTNLDAMKIQIANIRQQYLMALVEVEEENNKIATLNRSGICFATKLENEVDIDKYLAKIKEKLMQSLDGNDSLHII